MRSKEKILLWLNKQFDEVDKLKHWQMSFTSSPQPRSSEVKGCQKPCSYDKDIGIFVTF